MSHSTWRKFALPFIALFVGVACYFFLVKFVRLSDYAWTFIQPEYLDAVAEMLLAFWIYLITLLCPFSRPVYRYACIAVVFLAFAYLHAFFFGALVAAAYGLMIFMTGHLISRLLRKKDDGEPNFFHFCIIFGMCGLLLLVAGASALRVGTPAKLRIIFPIVFALELILESVYLFRNLSSLGKKLCRKTEPTVKIDVWSAVFLAVILTMMTAYVCRANLGMDYDSMWYGYRSEYVLAPATGIYDQLDMIACVYTYSKGIEALALVFSGLNTESFVVGVNLLFAALMLIALYDLGRAAKLEKKFCLLLPMLASLTPSIMTMCISAKADLSTSYLQVVVLLYSFLAMREKNNQYFILAIATLILSFAFKPTSIIFSTMLILILFVMKLIVRTKGSAKDLRFLIVPVLSVAVIWLRTVLIVGYPITSLVSPIMHLFGIYPKYPFTLPFTRMMTIRELFTTAFWERFMRLFKIFLAPNTGEMITLEITWWGPLLTVLWGSAMLWIFLRPVKTFKKLRKDAGYTFQLIALLLSSLLSGGCMMLLSTPDGNYFSLMQLLTYWFITTELAQFEPGEKKSAAALFSPLVLCNFLLTLAISPSWSLGLTKIDLKNHGYYNHELLHTQPVLAYNGMTDIYNYLKANPKRIINSFITSEDAAFLLPSGIESVGSIQTWGVELLENADSYQRFLLTTGVNALLVQDTFLQNNPHYAEMIQELAARDVLKLEYESGGFALLSVSEPDAANVETAADEYLAAALVKAE